MRWRRPRHAAQVTRMVVLGAPDLLPAVARPRISGDVDAAAPVRPAARHGDRSPSPAPRRRSPTRGIVDAPAGSEDADAPLTGFWQATPPVWWGCRGFTAGSEVQRRSSTPAEVGTSPAGRRVSWTSRSSGSSRSRPPVAAADRDAARSALSAASGRPGSVACGASSRSPGGEDLISTTAAGHADGWGGSSGTQARRARRPSCAGSARSRCCP